VETPKSRKLTKLEDWMITCHEAGHAVVGVRHEIAFENVVRGDGEYGEVPVGVGPIERGNGTQDEISRWQQFYAAGAAAERLLFGEYREYGSARDRYLHGELEKLRHSNRDEGWDRDIQSALSVLDRDSVERVAKELDRVKNLSVEQVYELLGCVPPWD
jgi:hypothetical protein